MLKSNFFALYMFAFSLLITVGCERSQARPEISEPPLRAGSPAVPINPAYVDERPSLSADGGRLVFVSGRSPTEGRPTMKAFRVEWVEGEAPGSVTRLTSSDDLGVERDAVISPDGKFVVISAAVGEVNDLFLTTFDGSSMPVRLTDESVLAGDEVSYGFSPDSRLIAWISRDLDVGTSILRVTEINAEGASGSVVDVKTTGSFVSDFAWVPSDSGYAMIVGSSAPGVGQLNYELIKFSTIEESSKTPDVTVLVEDVAPVTSVRAFANSQGFLFARRVMPPGSEKVAQAGDLITDSPVLTDANSEVAFVDLSSDAANRKIAVFADLPGSDVLAVGLTQDNSATFVLQRNAWQCASDGILRYGTAINIAEPDLSSFRRILPRMGMIAGTWEVAQDYCDRMRPDQTLGAIDDRIVSFRLNSAATAKKYRMAYVSRFSAARDKDCNYLLGDPEIFVLDSTEDARVIYPLSSNPAPMESAQRAPNQPPCGI